ncbi:LacI family DNA-binding transcriptional regulator [Amycolatopsis sp. NPDC059657]|uniref:LacI family DNA-binding transcriptional regulator n=1 Tax=Amycolatopsis sp. NPDC059657 TaxID=3346899 RepID=UPI00366E7AEC
MRGTSEVIGVVVGDLADPFFAPVVAGVQDQASPAGRLALICATGGDPMGELTHLDQLRRLGAGGVILVGGAVDGPRPELTERLAGLLRAGIRVVLCGRPPITGLPSVPAVTFDNAGGTTRLVEHLTAAGHRRIGYIMGPPRRSTTTERLAGFRSAAPGHDPRLVTGGEFTWESGWHAGQMLLRHKDLTAIVAANDLMAAGALAAARADGRSVPAQLSVAGFDDIECCQDTCPPLTTVHLPLREAGAAAGRLACGLDEPPRGGVIRLDAELVVRDTTGRVRA